MVEQRRRPNHVVILQAGPGWVDTNGLFDMNLRIRDMDARVFGHQLAVIGDQLDWEWTRRDQNWPPTPLQLLRPAQTLTRTVYRGIHTQLLGFQGLFAALKAWIVSTMPFHQRAEALTAWMSSFKPVTYPGWTRGALVTVALLAASSIFSALWMEGKV